MLGQRDDERLRGLRAKGGRLLRAAAFPRPECRVPSLNVQRVVTLQIYRARSANSAWNYRAPGLPRIASGEPSRCPGCWEVREDGERWTRLGTDPGPRPGREMVCPGKHETPDPDASDKKIGARCPGRYVVLLRSALLQSCTEHMAQQGSGIIGAVTQAPLVPVPGGRSDREPGERPPSLPGVFPLSFPAGRNAAVTPDH